MKKIVVSSVLFVLAAVVLTWTTFNAMPRPIVTQVVDTGGSEDPQEGALYQNGWVVANHGDAMVMDAYLRYQDLLGEPVSGFDGQCQSFRLGRLCYQPGNPSDWKLEFANLGLVDMQIEGYTPKPGSTPHPAVRDWLLSQLEAGVDVTRVVGRTLSDPVCDARTHACRQWTDKQLFLFDQGALTWDQVQRAPLGLWLIHPKTRPIAKGIDETSLKPDLAGIGIGVGLAIIGLVILQSRSHRPGSLPV